jgi:hypothetical protein
VPVFTVRGVFFLASKVEVSYVDCERTTGLHQLFKSNLTFCVFLICSLKNQSFLRRVVHQRFKSNLTFCVFNLQFEKLGEI